MDSMPIPLLTIPINLFYKILFKIIHVTNRNKPKSPRLLGGGHVKYQDFTNFPIVDKWKSKFSAVSIRKLAILFTNVHAEKIINMLKELRPICEELVIFSEHPCPLEMLEYVEVRNDIRFADEYHYQRELRALSQDNNCHKFSIRFMGFKTDDQLFDYIKKFKTIEMDVKESRARGLLEAAQNEKKSMNLRQLVCKISSLSKDQVMTAMFLVNLPIERLFIGPRLTKRFLTIDNRTCNNLHRISLLETESRKIVVSEISRRSTYCTFQTIVLDFVKSWSEVLDVCLRELEVKTVEDSVRQEFVKSPTARKVAILNKISQ